MEELVRQYREKLRQKDYEGLEDTWLELIQSGIELDRLLVEAELAEKHAPRHNAAILLSVLADHLKEQGRHDAALQVLRRAADLNPDSAELAHEIAGCIRKTHATVADLEAILHKSGLGYGQSLKEVLPRLDRYLALTPGSCVYDADRGPGRVKKLDLLLDRVTIDFDIGAELSWDVAVAARQLRPCAAGGYFDTLRSDRTRLRRLAAEAPGTLVRLLLRDTGRAMTVTDIAAGLAEVVPAAEWEGFWNRARRELAQDPHIISRTVPARTYAYSETPTTVSKTTTRPQASRFRLEPDEIKSMPEEKLLAAWRGLKTAVDRKGFLETVASARPDDWDRIYSAIFRSGTDARSAAIIEKALSASRPEAWQSLLEGILTAYRQYPEAFLWLVENAGRIGIAGPKGLLVRLLDLLEFSARKSGWTRLRNAITADDYAIVRGALETMERDEAERLLTRTRSIAALEGYRADEIGALVLARFPELEQSQADNFIYSTAAGIERARGELRHLTDVELPQSAEEIARARAHGDLSENYEYKAAKEKQARLLARINRLRDELALARPIRPDDIDTTEVSIGSRVVLRLPSGETTSYSILGPWDTDAEHGVISYLSPFARLLMGKKPGEAVELDGRPCTIEDISPAL